MGSWAAAAISKSGRIYVFYLKHLGDGSDHESGRLAIRCSDDAGATWTGRRILEPDLDGWQCYIACREVAGNLLLGYCLKDRLAWSRLTFHAGTR